MFGNKKEEDKISKPERLLNQYGLSDLKEEDREIMLDLFENRCFVNSAKILTVFTGGTVQQITNSLLVDLLKSNLMIIRQNDKIIKLLEERR
mgnify:CR=1 FL=1